MIKFKIYLLILFSDINTVDKIQSIYLLENNIYETKVSCAIIAYETGWLNCHKNKKRICSLRYNNIFGFYYKKKYIRFKSYSDCIFYYKRWQDKHWIPYHKKYPNKTYYDFLKWRGYCNNMNDYIKTIKRIENKTFKPK